jgi:hypothetical protein
MPIDYTKKIIFIHIPKNAGTSIEKSFNMQLTGHHRWNFYKQLVNDDWENYRKICIFRDPIERLSSCYRYARMEKSFWHSSSGDSIHGQHPDYQICKDKTINEIVDILYDDPSSLKHFGWKSQEMWISGLHDVEIVSFHNFGQFFEAIYGAKTLTHFNKSQKEEVVLTEESLGKLEQIYETDLAIWREIGNR